LLLGCLWGPKIDCRKDHHALIAFEIAQFGVQMQKIWLLVALNLIASKSIFTN
jgi:hypothetical protein